MKKADFYEKERRDKVEAIRCKLFTPEKKGNFIKEYFFPADILWCTGDCVTRRRQWNKCNGWFYRCKKCGSFFGNENRALDCPICKKREKEEASREGKK